MVGRHWRRQGGGGAGVGRHRSVGEAGPQRGHEEAPGDQVPQAGEGEHFKGPGPGPGPGPAGADGVLWLSKLRWRAA